MTTKKSTRESEKILSAVADDEPAQESNRRFRNFGEAVRASDLPPLEFELCGRLYHCAPAMNSKKLMGFVKRADDAGGSSAGDVIHDFIHEVILSEDREAWDALMDSDDYIIDIQLVSDVVSWLIENYSNRPTKP